MTNPSKRTSDGHTEASRRDESKPGDDATEGDGPADTNHPAGAEQAAENTENEPAG